MKVAFLVSAYNPCQWYRALEPARFFQDAEVITAGSGFLPEVIERAGAADVVQMSYVCQERELEVIQAIKSRGAAIALDYDDDIFQMGADKQVVIAALELADVVTVSTHRLAAAMRRWTRTPVAVVPNRVDAYQWHPQCVRTSGSVTIGYAGSRAHTGDLEGILGALWVALRSRKRARLVILGCSPIEVPPDLALRVEERPWVQLSEHREAMTELAADIAIAPLADNSFNHCRSALKWMQFGALGVPMVASAIPPYLDEIQDGYNGFLAADYFQWLSRLRALLDDPRLRGTMGAAARKTVSEQHDLARDAPARRLVYDQTLIRKNAKELIHGRHR